MNKIFALGLLALSFSACEMHDKKNNSNVPHRDYDADNTGKNVRDRDPSVKTPENQSESDADRLVTQNIRQALMDDSSLTANGKNIKVITINGVVTLRGPVGSPEEKAAIERKVRSVSNGKVIENQLEITRS